MAQQQEKLPSHNLLHDQAQTGLSAAEPFAADRLDELTTTTVSSPRKDAWRRFRRNWAAMISAAIILILAFAAIFAPFMHTMDPFAPNFNLLDAAPSGQHWLGTDAIGRDYYTRLLYGIRVPLVVAFLGTLITTVLGALIGTVSGYFGGITDSLFSRFTDVMFAFPGFVLALLIVTFFGQSLDSYLGGAGRVIVITVVFAIVGWPGLMRFVRSLVLSLKEQQFVEAARTCGSSHWKIMVRHLLPNTYGLIMVQASFIVVAFIGTEAALSLFGLGVTSPNADLGVMLYDGSQRMQITFWEVLTPSIVLTLLILSGTFVGDGLRDAVDPRGNN